MAGTKRKEFSVAYFDSALPQHVWDLIQPWLSERILITSEMIADMEACINPAMTAFKVARAAGVKAQKEYDLRVRRREEEERRRRREGKLRALRDALGQKVKSKETTLATVRERENWDGIFSTYTRTLKPEPGRSFTDWTINGNIERLSRLQRYLCILEEDGRIGWVRVADYRITFVNTGLHLSGENIAIDGESYSFGFEGVWTEVSDSNLLIQLHTDDGLIVCKISAWFYPGSLTVLNLEWTKNCRATLQHKAKLHDWIYGELFARRVMRLMTEPFTYKKGLAGYQADQFFGPVGTKVMLRVVAEHKWPVLVGSRPKDQ
ncbi:hypothetical protein C2U69_27535 [Cupriavidus pinatubonensis]|nr:hypothetical protein C2U69_27535 [Cupriavidus pinatubonensis]